MTNKFIGVRGVNKMLFRRFRARAIEDNMRLGDAIAKAMKHWLDTDRIKEKPKKLLLLKPFDWGLGTEKTSIEIDEILYGEKR